MKLGTQYCPRLRRADRAAERGCDRGAHPARLPRLARRAARAAGGEPQGLLHRPRQVGARQGPHPPARRRRVHSRPTSGRASSRFHEHTIELPVADVRAAPDNEADAARGARPRARSRQGRRARARAAGSARTRRWRSATARSQATDRDRVLGEARLPVVRHELSRARPAALLLQLPARLVRDLLRHRPQALRLRRGADRRGDLVERLVDGGEPMPCAACDGKRLNPTRSAVRFRGRSIADLTPDVRIAPSRSSSAISPRRDERRRSRGTSWPS